MRVLRPIQTLSPVLSHALTRRPHCSITQQHGSRLHARCASRTFTLPQPACSSRRPTRALCTASAAYDEAGTTSTASPAAAELSRQLAQEKPLSVVEGRERLRAAMPAEALRVAGVTFEGRQELVAALQPGSMLLLLLLGFSPSFTTRCMHAACCWRMQMHTCMPGQVQAGL